MSSVSIHVGGGGVNLGVEYWSIAAREAHCKERPDGLALASPRGVVRRRSPLFDARSGHARAIFVDGDCRSVEAAGARLGAGCVASANLVGGADRGCGKCFGDGLLRRAYLVAAAEERLRVEAERCARLSTVTLAFDLEGGSAGLAAALCQNCRDDYANATILGAVTSRRGFGSPLAPYNAAFALQQLREFSDATLWRDLREVEAKDERRAAPAADAAPFALDLAALTLPRRDWLGDRLVDVAFRGDRDVVAKARPDPRLFLLDARSTLSRPAHAARADAGDWAKLAIRLADAYPRADAVLDRPVLACAAAAVVRGAASAGFRPPLGALRRRLNPDLRRGAPGAVLFEPRSTSLSGGPALAAAKGDGGANPRRRGLAAVACLNLAPALVVGYVDKVEKLRGARAFLHRYEAAGLEGDDVAAAVEALCEVVDDYDARFGYLQDAPAID